MQKKMLLALGLCFALYVSTNAQNAPSDTIAITPLQGTKILLVGNSMERLVKENNFELQKNQFVTDMKEASKEPGFEDTKEVLYFVAPDGRRRLKAKPEELVPFDTQKEIQSFSSNLPPYHYTIFDLQRQFEYHIFLTQPLQLEELTGMNFTLAINALEAKEKKAKSFVRINVEQDNKEWKVTPTKQNRGVVLELSTSFAVGLYNSTLSPGLGVHADFVFMNKYRVPKYKIGTGFTLQALSEYQNFQFKNVHGAISADIRLLSNIAKQPGRSLWTGFLVGRLRSGIPEGSTVKHPLADRFKFGVAVESGFLGVEFGVLPPRGNESTLHNLTFRFRF
jgi:hypothetical protein